MVEVEGVEPSLQHCKCQVLPAEYPHLERRITEGATTTAWIFPMCGAGLTTIRLTPGGDDRIRTDNPLRAKQTLSR